MNEGRGIMNCLKVLINRLVPYIGFRFQKVNSPDNLQKVLSFEFVGT